MDTILSTKIEELKDDRIKKILLIKPSSLGDILQAFPAFLLLKKSLPNSKVDWIVNDNCAGVLDYIRKDLNNVIIFNRSKFKKKGRVVSEFFNLVKTVRKDKYDLTIDMQGLIRSAFMAGISRSPIRAGFMDVRERFSSVFYNRKISIPWGVTHAIEKNVSLIAGILGVYPVVPDFRLPDIGVDINRSLNNLGLSGKKYITVAPGARWETKMWPASFFASILDHVSEVFPELKILLLGSKSDIKVVKRVVEQCRKATPISLAGYTDIRELTEFIRKSELLLTNDSGPMHIAASMRVPVFAMFGPTLPERTGPYWQWNKIYQARSGCIKCLDRKCSTGTLECQSAISAQSVAEDIILNLRS